MKWLIPMLLLAVLAKSWAAQTSLCSPSEKLYFSCAATKGRHISVCGSNDLSENSGYLQYRFGVPHDVPELVFPSQVKHPRGIFEFGNEGFGAKSSARNLKFKIGKNTYVVYSSTYAFGTDAAGVAAAVGGNPIRRTKCQSDILESDFYRLQNVGLPAIDRERFVFEYDQ